MASQPAPLNPPNVVPGLIALHHFSHSRSTLTKSIYCLNGPYVASVTFRQDYTKVLSAPFWGAAVVNKVLAEFLLHLLIVGGKLKI